MRALPALLCALLTVSAGVSLSTEDEASLAVPAASPGVSAAVSRLASDPHIGAIIGESLASGGNPSAKESTPCSRLHHPFDIHTDAVALAQTLTRAPHRL